MVSIAEAQEYAEAYKRLKSIKAVAREKKCSLWKVKTRLMAAGVKHRVMNITRFKIPREALVDIAKSVKAGTAISLIAEQYGVSRQRIYQIKELLIFEGGKTNDKQ